MCIKCKSVNYYQKASHDDILLLIPKEPTIHFDPSVEQKIQNNLISYSIFIRQYPPTNTVHFLSLYNIKTNIMDIQKILLQLTSIINEKSEMIKLLNKWKNKYQYCTKDISNCDSAFVAKYIHSHQKQQSLKNLQIGVKVVKKIVSRENFWKFNEFKAFVWIVVGFCQVVNRDLKQITNSQIRFIMGLFPEKEELFIHYNIQRLEKLQRVSNKNWSHEQLSLFTDILKNEYIKDKWNLISYELFKKSQGVYYQSPHRCREMWYNYLNPKVRHGQWSIEEDYELFSFIQKFGLRWANISRSMDGARTEHMVKNRYTCLVKRNRVTFKRLGYDRFISYFLKQLKKKVKGKCPSSSSNNIPCIQQMELDDSTLNNIVQQRQPEFKQQTQERTDEILVQPFMIQWFRLKIHNDDSYYEFDQDLGCRFRQSQTHVQFFSHEERDHISGL